MGETCRRRKSVEDITPPLRSVQRRMNNRELRHGLNQWKIPQPVTLIFRQLFARPANDLGRAWIETLKIRIGRTILVVVSFHARNAHLTDDVHAFLWFVVVSDDIPEADRVCAALL